MPSVITLEDIADQLYGSGVHSPAQVQKILALVERYAQARQSAIILEAVDLYAHLKPGQRDVKTRKTRCQACLKVKQWRLFPGKMSKVCSLCLDKKQRPVITEDLELTCSRCGEKKKSSSFRRNGSSRTGFRYYCKDCT